MEPLIKLAPQFRFLWDELQGPESGAWREFNRPYATAADAATAWDQTYERSGGAGDDRARAYATDVYRAFNGGENNLPPNAQFGYNFLTQKGMSPEQAAGVTGRLMVESHARMDPAARNTLGGGSGTYGIAQWRGDRLENLAAANNVSMDDIRSAPISTPEGRYVANSQPQVTREKPMQNGLLGSFGPNTDQQKPWYKTDKFADVMGAIASAANSLQHNKDPNLDARLAQQKQGRMQKQTVNKTVQMLRAKGMNAEADAVESGMLDPRKAAEFLFGRGGSDNATIEALEWRAKNAGLEPGTPEYQQFIINEGGAPSNYRALEMQALAAGYEKGTPEFQRFMATRGSGVQAYDRATGTNTANIETGGPAAAAIAEGTVTGKAQGEAKVKLGGATDTGNMISSQINSIIEDPYLPEMLGPINSRKVNVTGDAARVQSKIDQLSGGVFLQAREALKGAGPLTDFESAKGEQAYARIQTAQSVKDFTEALRDFEYWMNKGIEKLNNQAQGQFGLNGGPAPAPSGDDLSDEELKRKYGG